MDTVTTAMSLHDNNLSHKTTNVVDGYRRKFNLKASESEN